eukprot:TRINITY_DN79_c0_g1_i7.p1 TRINITY_DN79_c0_g1~~TRINITY_DN79_c0_g1_i7.p1  ORF type:complete len:533 (+),score=95.89 TRINITY_DN79_c0_g1_i7:101-1699(+)
MSELTAEALAALKGAVAVIATGPSGAQQEVEQPENFDQIVASYKKRGRRNSSILRLQEEEREFKAALSAEAPVHALLQSPTDQSGPTTSPRDGNVAALTRSRSRSQLVIPTHPPAPVQRRPSLSLSFPAVVVVDPLTQSAIKDQTIEATVRVSDNPNQPPQRFARPVMSKGLSKLTVNTRVSVSTVGTARSTTIDGMTSEEIFLADCFIDVLKLLGYETRFCLDRKLPVIDRYYFLGLATEPYRQFYYFASLTSWLLSLSGVHMTPPKEYDDPSITTANIVAELKKLSLGIEIIQGKLKQGYGDHVMQILYHVSLNASQTVKLFSPIPMPDSYPEDYEVDSAEQAEDAIQEDFIDHGDDTEDNWRGGEQGSHLHPGSNAPVESKISADVWMLELERVRPSLQTVVRVDERDWRSHLESMRTHSTSIVGNSGDMISGLSRVIESVSKAKEKIESREASINSQMSSLIDQHRTLQQSLTKQQEDYGSKSHKLVQFTQELNVLNEEVDRTKVWGRELLLEPFCYTCCNLIYVSCL